MLKYTPGIHGFKVMKDETRDALQALWNSHPSHPHIHRTFIINEKIGSTIHGGPISVIIPDKEDDFYESKTLTEANQILDNDLLIAAVFNVISDEYLEEFPNDFRRETDSLSSFYGILEMIIMPGCVLLHFPMWDEACNEMINENMCDDHHDMWNLGIFAAGPTETAHEQMSAAAYIEAARSAWSPYIQNFNTYENSKVQVLDPKIHPDRQLYNVN
jgi:hypothetical protein